MFEEINILDDLGLFKEADELQKVLLANNFMYTKKKVDPRKRMQNQFDSINNQLAAMMEALDDQSNSGGGGDEDNITVEPFKEGDVDKVKFDIQQ